MQHGGAAREPLAQQIRAERLTVLMQYRPHVSFRDVEMCRDVRGLESRLGKTRINVGAIRFAAPAERGLYERAIRGSD